MPMNWCKKKITVCDILKLNMMDLHENMKTYWFTPKNYIHKYFISWINTNDIIFYFIFMIIYNDGDVPSIKQSIILDSMDHLHYYMWPGQMSNIIPILFPNKMRQTLQFVTHQIEHIYFYWNNTTFIFVLGSNILVYNWHQIWHFMRISALSTWNLDCSKYCNHSNQNVLSNRDITSLKASVTNLVMWYFQVGHNARFETCLSI